MDSRTRRVAVKPEAANDVPPPHCSDKPLSAARRDFSLSIWLLSLITSLLAGLDGVAQTVSPPAATSPTSPTPYIVGGKGPHHTDWMKVTRSTDAAGQARYETNRAYVEIATGMHYWEDGTWKEARPEFVVLADGTAVAGEGQHKVVISPILNDSNGTVYLETPDGKQMRSSIAALHLFNHATGQSVLMGEVNPDAVGTLVGANEVLFIEAFRGFGARVRYVYEKGAFHQDVIPTERLDLLELEAAGFPVGSSSIEVWTEFYAAPEPTITTRLVRSESDPQLRALMAEPDRFNDDLDFGVMKMTMGRAYAASADPDQRAEVPVNNWWTEIDGRQFLIESVPLDQAGTLFAQLPAGNSIETLLKDKPLYAGRRAPPVNPANKEEKTILTASLDRKPDSTGVVLDYQTINSSLTNFVFQGDTTYYITGPVNLYETATIEGGTVIKYTNHSLPYGDGLLRQYGSLQCQTAPYRPAVLTSMHDDSIGQTISGSTGSPAQLSTTYLQVYGSGSKLQYVRFVHASTALFQAYNDPLPVWHSQFVNCGIAIRDHPSGSSSRLQELYNVLISECGVGVINGGYFSSGAFAVHGVHVTADEVGSLLVQVPNSSMTGLFTNCMLAGVESLLYAGTVTLDHCLTNASGTGLYQTVGAGQDYLAAGSTNRNAGTTNISAVLADELKRKTTYPPILITNAVGYDVTLSQQAPRDTDTPDLGYHYDPIDWIADYFVISNATLTVEPGVVVAGYNNTSIWLADHSDLQAIGAPGSPIWFTRYHTVQEQPVALGPYSPSSGLPLNPYCTNEAARATATLRFVRMSAAADTGCSIYHNSSSWSYRNLMVEDSEIYNGTRHLAGSDNTSASFRNTLFHRGTTYALVTTTNTVFNVSNCAFYGLSALTLHDNNAGKVKAYNNAFDGCTLSFMKNADNGYNAYINCNTNLLPWSGTDYISSTPIAWQACPLGNWHQPTNSPLFDAGSTNANVLGLYHHTTTTNQLKEATSIVDIGLHYVGMEAVGQPVDSDGDGLPDYLEDRNGNGNVDAGETSFTDSDSDDDALSDFGELYTYNSDPLDEDSLSSGVLDGEYLFAARAFLGSGSCSCNSLAHLHLALPPQGSDVLTFTISQAPAHSSYDLYFVNNAFAPHWQWRRVFSGVQCDSDGGASFTLEEPDPGQGYFVILNAADTDGDGLANGYECWFNYNGIRTCLDEPDTDMDGMEDGWEVQYGLDPASDATPNGATDDPDGDSNDNRAEHDLYFGFPYPNPVEAFYDPLKDSSQPAIQRPVVTISGSDSSLPATFTITRRVASAAELNLVLTVYYAVGGNLTYATDYTLNSAPLPSDYPRIFSLDMPALVTTELQQSVTVTVNITGGGSVPCNGPLVVAVTPHGMAVDPQVPIDCGTEPCADAEDWAYVVDWKLNRVKLLDDLWTDDTPNPEQLAQWIMAGTGISVVQDTAEFTGASVARGIFRNGFGAGLPIDKGVILSSGDIALAKGPNDQSATAGFNFPVTQPSTSGDSDLDGLVADLETFDAAVLEFDIVSISPTTLTFTYVFASEEYPEFVASQWNDLVGIFVDGVNIAIVPNTTLPVAVNNVNGGYLNPPTDDEPAVNPLDYVDNHDPSFSAQPPNVAPVPVYNIQYDGTTSVLSAQTSISANITYTIKIAIADASDANYDSAVFIKAEIPCP